MEVMAANQITVFDLERNMQARKQKERDHFCRVLESCYTRIRRTASRRLHQCTFCVPQIVFGMPLIDVNACTAYLTGNLIGNGFQVDVITPRMLVISWNSPWNAGASKTTTTPSDASNALVGTKKMQYPRYTASALPLPLPSPSPSPSPMPTASIDPSSHSSHSSHSIAPYPRLTHPHPHPPLPLPPPLSKDHLRANAGPDLRPSPFSPPQSSANCGDFHRSITQFKPSGKFALRL